jgi:hypothetical protein
MRVVLLRPNDFIVDAMLALLKLEGFDARRLHHLGELTQEDPAALRGAVASTAASSAVRESFVEVVTRLKQFAPDAPLVATTMARDLGIAQDSLERELKQVGPGFEVVRPGAGPRPRALGTPSGVLLLRKEEIEAAGPATREALRRHFSARAG